MNTPSFNKEWFRERLSAMKISQRGLAKLIDIDPAAISYMFNGKRAMSMDEAKSIASIIRMPVTEVMRQAGIDVTDDVCKVPVKGYISNGHEVSMLPDKTFDMIIAPPNLPAKSYALQMRNPGRAYDGWLIFVSGEHVEDGGANMDHFSLAALSDGKMVLATIKRGYKAHSHNLLLAPDLGTVMENKQVAWSSRVMWIMPT